MTIFRDATAINDGTTAIMAVSLRNHGDNGGATAVYAVQAPQWYRASGVTGVSISQPILEFGSNPKLTTVSENSLTHSTNTLVTGAESALGRPRIFFRYMAAHVNH